MITWGPKYFVSSHLLLYFRPTPCTTNCVLSASDSQTLTLFQIPSHDVIPIFLACPVLAAVLNCSACPQRHLLRRMSAHRLVSGLVLPHALRPCCASWSHRLRSAYRVISYPPPHTLGPFDVKDREPQTTETAPEHP